MRGRTPLKGGTTLPAPTLAEKIENSGVEEARDVRAPARDRHPNIVRQRAYRAEAPVYSYGPRKAMGRPERHELVKVARRVVKRLATQPRAKLSQLSPSRRDEWREMRAPRPTHEDGWLMRVLGCLVAWGEFEA